MMLRKMMWRRRKMMMLRMMMMWRRRTYPKTATHTLNVRVCAVEMHLGMLQEPLYAEIYRKNADS